MSQISEHFQDALLSELLVQLRTEKSFFSTSGQAIYYAIYHACIVYIYI